MEIHHQHTSINASPASHKHEVGEAAPAVYFIGIGGIGMSALARYFHAQGYQVSGYDKVSTPLTQHLEQTGMAIHYEENIELIPKQVSMVVYTPAIPAQHAELVYYKQHDYKVLKRSDVLQWITEHAFNVCIAGTHGKTTVTTLTAHILRHSGYGCNAFLGGIASNYGTNFWSHSNNVVVVEADEYDRSFLKLKPDVAVITYMDADHLDIYGTEKELQKAFVEFAGKIKPKGLLISKKGLNQQHSFLVDHQQTYSFNDTAANVYAADIKVENGTYRYDVHYHEETITDVVLPIGGLHNIENSVAAIAVAKHLGISNEAIKAAIADFKGVKRRFEYIIKSTEQVLIDDYAHHPEELKALITGIRSLYPNEKLTLAFQPHLYSRTKDLAADFATSLSMADAVVLLPIYPARELPIEGVTSTMLIENMTIEEKQVLEKSAFLDWVAQEKPSLLVMAGAGDIDTLIPTVKEILLTNNH